MIKIIMFALISFTLVEQSVAEAFKDEFNTLNYETWSVSDWKSPAFKDDHHYGNFVTHNVWVNDGYLVLKLEQSIDSKGVIYSEGSEISTKQEFLYGTFEFNVRFSSDSNLPNFHGNPISGSVGGAFLYSHEPFSEIDIEVENSKSDTLHTLTWEKNETNKEHFEVNNDSKVFKTYTIIWEPNTVSFYVDGILSSVHSQVVPKEPMRVFFNHWGTDSEWWGGKATIGQPRYMFVDYFSYKPLTYDK